MNKNILKIISVLLIITLSVFVLKNKFLTKKELTLQEKNNLIINQILKNDESVIKDPRATDFNLTKSITRLSLHNSEVLKNELKILSAHSSLKVRMAAIEASGNYVNKGQLNLLISSLNAPEKEIRLAALRGLSRIAEPNNIQTILKYLRMPNITHEERLEANLTLIKITPSIEQQKIAEKNILESINLKDENDQLVLINLYPYFNNEKQLIESARILALQTTPNLACVRSIQYLASSDRDWFQLNITNILKSKNPLIQNTIKELSTKN